jgi:hypothetical protein
MIWMNKVLGQGLFMEHCSFEFQIFVGFESWWCDLGLPKEGKSREEEKFHRHIVLGNVGGVTRTL